MAITINAGGTTPNFAKDLGLHPITLSQDASDVTPTGAEPISRYILDRLAQLKTLTNGATADGSNVRLCLDRATDAIAEFRQQLLANVGDRTMF